MCEPSASLVVSHPNVYVVPATVGTTAVATPSTSNVATSGAVPPVTVAVTGTILLAKVQSGGTVTTTLAGPEPIVNETGADVALLPALSVTTLVSECVPLASPARLSVAE